MPVDKAFEEQRKRPPTQEAKRFADKYSNVYVNFHNTYQQALAFHDAFIAGQKSLSPEVREVLEKVGINYMQKITYADKTKPEESRCLHCLCSAVYGSPIEHGEGCIVPISQNLLAKE